MSKQNLAANAKLKICMFGDGDIIGTTKKNHVESGLLAA